ncbi:MAG: hypothetical protein WCJ95_20495 [Mariniphaga sp.]
MGNRFFPFLYASALSPAIPLEGRETLCRRLIELIINFGAASPSPPRGGLGEGSF